MAVFKGKKWPLSGRALLAANGMMEQQADGDEKDRQSDAVMPVDFRRPDAAQGLVGATADLEHRAVSGEGPRESVARNHRTIATYAAGLG